MSVKISYSKRADKFLEKNQNKISEEEIDNLIILAIKKIFKLEDTNIDLKMLKGELRGHFRIKKGDIRIIFTLEKRDIVEAIIKDIDFRGNIY